MNLTNFHITNKSLGKFVTENTCSIEGQGLVDTYDIILFGNKHNVYTFTLIDNENMFYHFVTKDKYLINWRIRRHSENEQERSRFEFKAFGVFDTNREWSWAFSHDSDDYVHLEIDGIKYFVNDLRITNKHPEILPINDIYCDRQYWKKYVSVNYQNIQKIIDSNKKIPRNFTSISISEIEIGKQYYLVSENKIFPITINNIEQKSDVYTDIVIDVIATATIQKIKTNVTLHLEEISREICYDTGDTGDNCYNVHVDSDCEVIDNEIFVMVCKNL